MQGRLKLFGVVFLAFAVSVSAQTSHAVNQRALTKDRKMTPIQATPRRKLLEKSITSFF